MGVTGFILELVAVKAQIRGAFSRLYYCYDYRLCREKYKKCSKTIGQFFYTIIVPSTDKEWL